MNLRERIRLVREDCRADAEKPIPFTPLGIGTVHGELLAMIDALAASIVEQQDQIDSMGVGR